MTYVSKARGVAQHKKRTKKEPELADPRGGGVKKGYYEGVGKG